MRQEGRYALRPFRRPKQSFRQEKLRRFRNSLLQFRLTCDAFLVTGSSCIQVACDGHRHKLMLSSIRAWRRWAPIVRCAADHLLIIAATWFDLVMLSRAIGW